jgi:hypothetical protein
VVPRSQERSGGKDEGTRVRSLRRQGRREKRWVVLVRKKEREGGRERAKENKKEE